MKCSLLPLSLAGPGNQFCGIKESLIIAETLKLPLILPKVIPHYTIREHSRKAYDFDELFDVEYLSNVCSSKLFVDILPASCASNENRHPILMRSDPVSTAQAFEYYDYYLSAMALRDDVKQFDYSSYKTSLLRTRKDIRDFAELHNITEKHTSLVGVFNNVKIGGINKFSDNLACSKNHCLNCKPNPEFESIYSVIQSSFQFSKFIRDIGDRYIQKVFKDREFNAFHMRVSDLTTGRKFIDCYNGLTEEKVFDILMSTQDMDGLQSSDIFIAAPPQLKQVKDLKIFCKSSINFYHNPDVDPFISSLIEQYICSKSKRFIRSYTNTPDQPRKKHTRSSWSELVEGMRIRDNYGERKSITFDDLIYIVDY